MNTTFTEKRSGREIEPTKVQCPGCEKTGVTQNTVNMCGSCGNWFEVSTDDES